MTCSLIATLTQNAKITLSISGHSTRGNCTNASVVLGPLHIIELSSSCLLFKTFALPFNLGTFRKILS